MNTGKTPSESSGKTFAHHHAKEACRKLGMTLPPMTSCANFNNAKPVHRKIHNVKSMDTRKSKHSSTVSLTIGRSMSDYIKKPVYFCHPLMNTQKRLTDQNNEMESCPSGIKTILFPEKHLKRLENKRSRSLNRNCSANLSKKFKEFCKKEGFDYCSDSFEKASGSCKTSKKFAKVAKAPKLWVIRENNIDQAPLRPQLPFEESDLYLVSDEKTRKRDTRQSILENARLAAEQGKSAASKAISFILSDSHKSSASRKRLMLPPLERSSLHSFTSTWNPDVSIATHNAT